MNMIPCESTYGDEDEGIDVNIPDNISSDSNSTRQNPLKRLKALASPPEEYPMQTSNSNNSMYMQSISSTTTTTSHGFNTVIKYLPIKKRRLKESLRESRQDPPVEIQPFENFHKFEKRVQEEIRNSLGVAASSSTSHSTAIMSNMYTDNSREWWLHANESWNKNARPLSHPFGSGASKKDSTPPKSQQQRQNTSNNNTGGGTRNLEMLQKEKLDKDDPRSLEYQMWFDSYYPINAALLPVPSSRSKTCENSNNNLLDKLKIVNPEEFGGKYPPWVSFEQLTLWDINNISIKNSVNSHRQHLTTHPIPQYDDGDKTQVHQIVKEGPVFMQPPPPKFPQGIDIKSSTTHRH